MYIIISIDFSTRKYIFIINCYVAKNMYSLYFLTFTEPHIEIKTRPLEETVQTQIFTKASCMYQSMLFCSYLSSLYNFTLCNEIIINAISCWFIIFDINNCLKNDCFVCILNCLSCLKYNLIKQHQTEMMFTIAFLLWPLTFMITHCNSCCNLQLTIYHSYNLKATIIAYCAT